MRKFLINSIQYLFTLLLVSIVMYSQCVPYEVKRKFYQTEAEVEYDRFLDSLFDNAYKEAEVDVTVTVYNPVEGQCDEDPLTTADGSRIRMDKLKRGDLKWIAISHDLRETFKYGDSVTLEGHPDIDGDYVVHDLMNPRFVGRIDILRPAGDIRGQWVGIIMKKKK